MGHKLSKGATATDPYDISGNGQIFQSPNIQIQTKTLLITKKKDCRNEWNLIGIDLRDYVKEESSRGNLSRIRSYEMNGIVMLL